MSLFRRDKSRSHTDYHLCYVLRNCDIPLTTCVTLRDVEAEVVEAEAEARKIHLFRFHIGGKNGGRKEIGSAILRRRTNRGSINIKK